MKDKIVGLFKNRRVWAAVLSGLAAFLSSLGYNEVVSVLVLVAGGLGLHSFIRPK